MSFANKFNTWLRKPCCNYESALAKHIVLQDLLSDLPEEYIDVREKIQARAVCTSAELLRLKDAHEVHTSEIQAHCPGFWNPLCVAWLLRRLHRLLRDAYQVSSPNLNPLYFTSFDAMIWSRNRAN